MHSVDNGECGKRFPIPKKRGEGITLYNPSGSTISKGTPVVVQYNNTVNSEYRAVAAATHAYPVQVAIAMDDVATLKIGKFQISGECEALIEDADIAAGRYLEVINAGTELIDNGASRTDESAAILKDAQANGDGIVVRTVILVEVPHNVEAS